MSWAVALPGAGTDTITINGVIIIHGVDNASPFQIEFEAGTLLIAGAITRGDIFVRGAIKEHMAGLVIN
ncbi:hypothetical protein ACVXZZ_02740 [Staphylococcus aureus]